VISGAIGYLQEHFHLAAEMTGWAASSLLIGCMFGALLGGPLSDRFGRKPMLIMCAVIFALSGVGSAVAVGGQSAAAKEMAQIELSLNRADLYHPDGAGNQGKNPGGDRALLAKTDRMNSSETLCKVPS
jgi:hypothetical protein